MQTVTLHDISDDQLLCMRGALGHQWETISKPYREGQWGHRINERCTRCGSKRTTIFNIYGIEAARYYEHPANFIKVTEPYETADVRLEYLRRTRNRGQRRAEHRALRAV